MRHDPDKHYSLRGDGFYLYYTYEVDEDGDQITKIYDHDDLEFDRIDGIKTYPEIIDYLQNYM